MDAAGNGPDGRSPRRLDADRLGAEDMNARATVDVHDATSLKGTVRFPTAGGLVELPTGESPPSMRRTTVHHARASSRASVVSRSSSPPNSVDAFAPNPRPRERTNTIESKAVSDLGLRPQRTVSGGTGGRRPTFIEEMSHAEPAVVIGSKRGSIEADVCYPPPMEGGADEHVIDFDVLEEFVALSRSTPTAPSAAESPMGSHQDLSMLERRPSTIPGVSRAIHHPVPFVDDSRADDTDEKDVDMCSLKKLPSVAGHQAVEPSRFSFFSSELDSTVHAAELGDLIMPTESFRELFELNPGGGVWWLDVLNPKQDELGVLARAFGIHPLTSEDIATQESREKVELFKQYYFVCFRSFHQPSKMGDDDLEPLNVYMVVFRKGILTFTFSPSPHSANVRRRIGKLRYLLSLSSDWVCYALIDDIVDSFGPAIQHVENETDTIEDQVFVARADDSSPLLRQIGFCRRKAMALMRLLGGKADVIKGFGKRCNEKYSVAPRAEIAIYLSDVQDHVVTMMSNLGHFETILSRSHTNYLAQISVEQIKLGNATNDVLSKITLIATILVPLNVICGLFGMNVPVPGRESTNLTWFFGILGVISLVIAASLAFAKKKKYI